MDPDPRTQRIYLLAGEASGDLHAANLVKALKARQPGLQFRGMGGDRMAAEGVTLVRHIRETNFMGFVVVLLNLRTILRMFRQVKADILAYKPQAVILVDYPGFNLRMARFCHQQGIRVYYYISPQLWAWKAGRVKQVKAYVHQMYCILPFEQEWYRQRGVAVAYVGHPLLDALQPAKFADKPLEPQRLALLPGSRAHEITRMLPVMLAAAAQFPQLQPVLAAAPTQSREWYETLLKKYPQVELAYADVYRVLRDARFALVTSGTATLETALHETPQVVCYAGNWLSYQIARRLVKVKYISLVNLIMDREVVKELIQGEMNPRSVAKALGRLVTDGEARRQQLEDYRELRDRLGKGGASDRTAAKILEDLERDEKPV
ncbi:MAG: lipid-A-disaccharide synthase [Bacteroidetes bacterium]|nr:lipid-A-disaccharide synthase [Bacteroidota bacterium]